MPGVVRLNDNCSGHGCWSPRSNASSSLDTFVNSQKVERKNDTRKSHCCASCHTGKNIGSHNVYVNNRDIQVIGDPVDCGSTQVEGSSDVFVN